MVLAFMRIIFDTPSYLLGNNDSINVGRNEDFSINRKDSSQFIH